MPVVDGGVQADPLVVPPGSRVLVTGASGYIGGRLVGELVRAGYEVRCVARTRQAVRARAELYARASGLRVVRILSISEGGGYSPPMPVMYAKAAMADAAPTPVAAGEVETSITVSVQFELAP